MLIVGFGFVERHSYKWWLNTNLGGAAVLSGYSHRNTGDKHKNLVQNRHDISRDLNRVRCEHKARNSLYTSCSVRKRFKWWNKNRNVTQSKNRRKERTNGNNKRKNEKRIEGILTTTHRQESGRWPICSSALPSMW